MELASMLAGEPFSDHPQSVCPVIAALLRAYNDWVDDERRQELYGYAANVVGSRGPTSLERARAERVASWIYERPPGRLRRVLGMHRREIMPWPPYEPLASEAVRALATRGDEGHHQFLASVDRLVAMGDVARQATGTAPYAGPDSAPSPRSPAHTVD